MHKFNMGQLLFVAVAFGVFGLTGPLGALAATAPDLGASGNFVILTHAGITDVPTSIITGNIGTDGTASSIGVTCAEVTGTIYAIAAGGPPCSTIDATTLGTAMTDMQTAYTTANGKATSVTNTGNGSGEIGGQTLASGVYTFTGGSANVLISTNLTLNGDADAVWIFQIPGTLDIATGISVKLIGGAQASNIFWVVAGQTTLHAGSTLEGTVLDYAGIAMQAGATLNGRALSHTASVTLISSTISAPVASAPVILPACGTGTFDAFTTGSVNGQNGWSATGPYDQAIVSNTYGFSTFGCKALRVSNAVTSGAFGDQTFAAPLANSVGEASSTAGTFAVGTKNNHFEVQFDIASALTTLQTGLAISVSPDRGDGSRMSYLRFEDQADGIHVFFDDVQGTTSPANFVETDVATITRAPHTIKLTMDTLDGPSNDVVKVYIDGVLVHTGTSWENYYRYDAEASAEQSPRIVKTLIIAARGTAVPANSGNGFLFDNLSLSAYTVAITTPDTNGNQTTVTNSDSSLTGTSTASTNNVTVTANIPSGTTVTGNSTWDGNIAPPTAPTTTPTVTTSGFDNTVTSAVTIGSSESDLTFSNAVRLVFAGQANTLAGWYNNAGVFTEITDTCSADDQTTENSNLAAGSSCKIDVGSDLIVWTKHFSTFVTYTQTATPAPAPVSNSSGGGAYFSSGNNNQQQTVQTVAVGQVLGAFTVSPVVQLQINAIKEQLVVLIQQLIVLLKAQLVIAQQAGN